jgi:hypothetical protein
MSSGRQPFLHDLVVCLAAPTVALSGRDGQIRPAGAQGVLHADIRVLSRAEVQVGGETPVPVAHGMTGAATGEFVSLVRGLGGPAPDPTMRLERRREVSPGAVHETLRLGSDAAEAITTELVLTAAADLLPIDMVKGGQAGPPVGPTPGATGAEWRSTGLHIVLDGGADASVSAAEGTVSVRWPVSIPAGQDVTVRWSLRIADEGAVVGPAPVEPSWDALRVESDDPRLPRLVSRSLEDLHALRMSTPAHRTRSSSPPVRPGTSRCSDGTASGPRACCCPSPPA